MLFPNKLLYITRLVTFLYRHTKGSCDSGDSYDKSNYRSLLLKTGTTKKVFGVFTSDVLAEDVYAVTTKSSNFFDTEQEAEVEYQYEIKESETEVEEKVIYK